MDFREMGYRECMLDISDYLLNDGEHLELNDTSFRARLMSHLKCSTPNRNILNDMFLLAIANSFGQVNQH